MCIKEDIRITKSKRDLRNGLVALLSKTPFEKLTINEICSAAMINKMTFYKHYADKYALLNDCIQSIAIDVYNKSIGTHPKDFLKGSVKTNCLNLLEDILDECVRQRKIIFALVNSSNSLSSLIVKNSIEKMIKNLIIEISIAKKLKYSVKNISAFLTGGFSSLILEQLQDPSKQAKETFLSDASRVFSDILDNNILFE